MLLWVTHSLDNREVTSRPGRQRRVPSLGINTGQEQWSYPPWAGEPSV